MVPEGFKNFKHMLEGMRGNQLLHEITFADRSSQFQISEYSQLEEFERRTRSHLSQRLAEEDQELSLVIGLRSEMLVTVRALANFSTSQ
ncbi:unnamed protein product [Sphagnum balticum]